jgi:hypothetical protein
MPITICHPVAAVPLRRLGLVLSALIIGSLMPDFEFFLRLGDGKGIAHTIPGIFLFDVPVGLIVLTVFHLLIKYPVLSLLSHHAQSRLYRSASSFTFFPIKRFCLIIVSLIIGTVTHTFCDGFTHADGWFVEKLAILSAPVFTLPQGTVRVYFLLQYMGSAFGALLLAYWYLKWYYNENPITHIVLHKFHFSKQVWIVAIIGVFSVTAGVAYGSICAYKLESVVMMKKFITYSTIATFSSFLVALITFGALWHYKIPRHKRIRCIYGRPHSLLSNKNGASDIGVS